MDARLVLVEVSMNAWRCAFVTVIACSSSRLMQQGIRTKDECPEHGKVHQGLAPDQPPQGGRDYSQRAMAPALGLALGRGGESFAAAAE